MIERAIVRSVDYSGGVVTCDIETIRTSGERTDIPIRKPFSGTVQPPRIGETVTVEKMDDGQPIITGVLSRRDAGPEEVQPGEYTITLDGSTFIKFTQNGDTYDVEVSAGGDVDVTADGQILIDGIPFSEHTHSYEDSTTESTSTKTTDPPA